MIDRLRGYGATADVVPTISRRAAAHAAADGAGDQGPGHRPLRVDRLHLGQRRQGRAREVRGVRPRRPRLRRPQDRRRRRRHRRRRSREWGIEPDLVPARRAVRRRACSRTGRRTTTCSTRSTGSSCRAPTSPPRPSSPACTTWAGRSTTSPPTAPCAPPRRPRRCARRSRPASSTRSCFTSSSTVRNLVGIAGKPHAVDGRRRASARPRPRPPRSTACGSTSSRPRPRPTRWSTRSPTTASASRSRPPRPASRSLRPSASARRRRRRARRQLMAFPARAAPAAAADARRCGGWWPRPGCTRRDLVLPVFVARGRHRAGADRARCRASSSTRSTRCVQGRPRGGRGRPRRADALRRAAATRTPSGSRRRRPRRHPQRRAARPCATPSATTSCVMADLCLDEFTDHGHCGVLDERGARRQRRDPRALRRDGARAGRAPAPTWSAPRGMMDGQVAGDPARRSTPTAHRTP